MASAHETFTTNLDQFHSDQKHYLDASGNFIGYTATDSLELIKNRVHDDEYLLRKKLFEEDNGIVPIGLSNVNFGHITKPEEFGGTMLQDLIREDWRWNPQEKLNDNAHKELELFRKPYHTTRSVMKEIFDRTPNSVLIKGELTAPLVEAVEEQGSEEETQWQCKGCSKYFATKASLKRHHERKKSCKELCEKPAATSEEVALPDKPYIVDWVDQLITKAIVGESDKPYCKHCDVEFANKTNLNKHLSKSVACDKLAKQEFLKLLTN
jgi:hypothetical protein